MSPIGRLDQGLRWRNPLAREFLNLLDAPSKRVVAIQEAVHFAIIFRAADFAAALREYGFRWGYRRPDSHRGLTPSLAELAAQWI
jgi:hypothetical protein